MTSPVSSPVVSKQKKMDFSAIVKELISGKRLTRLEWDNKDIYIFLSDQRLRIYHPETNMIHDLVVSLGDLDGKDWVVV